MRGLWKAWRQHMHIYEMGTDPDMSLQLAVERLHARYAHALDADRLEEWPQFFTENGRYRIATAENEERGMPLPCCTPRAAR